eukprot:125685-Chlamydomonas_euryale.AAC.1
MQSSQRLYPAACSGQVRLGQLGWQLGARQTVHGAARLAKRHSAARRASRRSAVRCANRRPAVRHANRRSAVRCANRRPAVRHANRRVATAAGAWPCRWPAHWAARQCRRSRCCRRALCSHFEPNLKPDCAHTPPTTLPALADPRQERCANAESEAYSAKASCQRYRTKLQQNVAAAGRVAISREMWEMWGAWGFVG